MFAIERTDSLYNLFISNRRSSLILIFFMDGWLCRLTPKRLSVHKEKDISVAATGWYDILST